MKIQHIHIWEQSTEDHVYKNVFVQIELKNGISGLGSAAPVPEVTGELFSDCISALSKENLEFIIGRDIRQLPKLIQEVTELFPKKPATRAALDIALHDAFTKYLDVPLGYYLGQRIKSLPTSVTIGMADIDKTMYQAEEYFGRGFRIFKVRLGQLLEEDIERLTRLREKYGDQIDIQIDLNQAHTYDQLLSFHQKTAHLDITLIEQPLPSFLPIDMKRLPLYLKNKVVADESLINIKDALSLINGQKACNLFNIKLMKCGGISPALKIADITAHSSIDLVWGCYVETPVSTAAALHTALSRSNTRYLDLGEGLSTNYKQFSGGFKVDNGYLSLTSKPGLGILKHEGH